MGELRIELIARRAVNEDYRRLAREFARSKLRQIRALDAVREEARDRSFMADVWMYIACGLHRDEAVKRARSEHGMGP